MPARSRCAFTAGGIDEMCWHLFTWGDSVTVEKPARLRKRLTGMCASLTVHHRGRRCETEYPLGIARLPRQR